MASLAQIAHITIHGNVLPENNDLTDKVKASLLKAAIHSSKPRAHIKSGSKKKIMSSLNSLL